MTDGANDPPITADKIDSDPGGDLTGDLSDDKGYLVYDYAAEHVPQPRLAGPAASLTEYPLPASDLDYIDPLTVDSNGNLAVELGNGLTLDSNGRISVPAGAITEEMLAFAAATEEELSSHANDETNPHSVTTDQIGAVTDTELSNHAGDNNAHHSQPNNTNTDNLASTGRISTPHEVRGFQYKEVELTGTSSTNDKPLSLVYADGSEDSYSISGYESFWVYTRDSPIIDITGDTYNVDVTMVNKIVAAPHSHGI
ncbi:hypothetical protein BRC71_06345 [Halobacteriales archaeon QH_7_65_31]|nr:MAG: hypothetical protein BRC71_06345 [Halobacteriales archaeon QH_7_65_31]